MEKGTLKKVIGPTLICLQLNTNKYVNQCFLPKDTSTFLKHNIFEKIIHCTLNPKSMYLLSEKFIATL